MHPLCPPPANPCMQSNSVNSDCRVNLMHHHNSPTTSNSCRSPPNHSGSSMHDPELSATESGSNSSCEGKAIQDIYYLDEGQGQSSCDEYSARNHSSMSRIHDTAEYGECPSETDTVTCISLCVTATDQYRSSCFNKDIEQEQEYFQQILGSSSYGWTNEKHSSYLDSMEADFLRRVMFRGSVLADEEPSSDLSDSASSQEAKSPKKFKVCQNGRWRPKNLNASAYVGPLAQVAVAVKNPWIKRFQSPSKPTVSPSILEDPLLQVAMESARRRWRHEQA